MTVCAGQQARAAARDEAAGELAEQPAGDRPQADRRVTTGRGHPAAVGREQDIGDEGVVAPDDLAGRRRQVPQSHRPIVTAGLANEVDAVNQ